MNEMDEASATRRSDLLARAVRAIEGLCAGVGQLVAWCTLAMVLLTFVVVVLRYQFEFGRIWMQELSTWMHGLVFLLAAAYTLQLDEHVRVDLFYRRMSERQRALVDLSGVLTLLLPVAGFLLWSTWPYAVASWVRQESSRATDGLPFPFVPLAKSALVLMAILVILQGLAMALRAVATLQGRPLERPRAAPAQASHVQS
ncbi:MAG: TRAP transporter small permease subunit [Pseudomonadota bacterium]